MSDEFITNLRNDWKAQDSEFEVVRRRLVRARWMTSRVMAIEAIVLVFGVAAGIWFAIIAWKYSDVLFALSAATLLFVALPSAVVLFRLRYRLLADGGKAPEDVLRHALSRTHEIEKILTIGLWNAVALVIFVGILWGFVWAGWIPHRYPLLTLSGVWTVSAGIAFAWFAWRRRRNAREREQCTRLLLQYEGARAAEN